MPRSRNTQGAIFMSMAMAGFSASDALSKSVIGDMNAGQIMFIRGLFTSILIYLIENMMLDVTCTWVPTSSVRWQEN